MALRYTPVVDDQLLLVTRLCEQFFCTKNTFLTVSVIRKPAIIKKEEYLIRAHCVRHVKHVMQRSSRDRLLQSITADSLLCCCGNPACITQINSSVLIHVVHAVGALSLVHCSTIYSLINNHIHLLLS